MPERGGFYVESWHLPALTGQEKPVGLNERPRPVKAGEPADLFTGRQAHRPQCTALLRIPARPGYSMDTYPLYLYRDSDSN